MVNQFRNRASVFSVDADVFFDDEAEDDPMEPKATDPNRLFFPTMTQNLQKAYNIYCRNDVNLYAILPLMVFSTIIMIVRLNFQNPNEMTLFYVSDAFFVMAVALFSINLSPLVLRQIHKNSTIADKMENLIARVPFHLEDVTMYGTILCLGFNLVGRVVAGKCPDDVSFWETQTCTLFVSSVPSDMIMLLYITPLVFIIHTAIKSVSISALIFSWCLIIGFVAFCIIYHNAWSQIWELYNSVFFVAFTFMVERNKRIAFLRLMELKEQKIKAWNLQNSHMAEKEIAEQRRLVEIASVTATNERNLRVTETQQLRNLMGNVAHDLKTPLFSIEADIEFLKLLFNTIPPQAVQIALTSISQSCHGQNVDLDPANIFDSLWSTCRFMIAAINRGQDFAKSSQNIALVPSQGTIEVCKTMATAVRCVRHLLPSDTSLVSHPLASNFGYFIITDGHWLLENLLCLLSNAIKYSSSGEISLMVELVQEGSEPGDGVLVRLDADGIPIASSASQVFSHHDTITRNTMVLVTVEDEGVGVSPEGCTTLFQPFKQAQRLAGGTGLGLFSLCKRVEALGGKCGFTDRRDGQPGSLFWFTFPYRRDDTVLTNAPRMHISSSSRRSSLQQNVISPLPSMVGTPPLNAFPGPSLVEVQPLSQSKKILLLDDTPSIIKVIGRLLQVTTLFHSSNDVHLS